MAEAWTRHLLGDRFDALSAGIAPHGVDPHMVTVMHEAGVDITRQHSKSITDIETQHSDLVVTVCDKAAAACPVFPDALRTLHHAFDDPPRLARTARSADDTLQTYRRVRDQIRDFVETLPFLFRD